MLEIFSLPFMQRAFIAGIFTAILLGWLGVYVVARRMSFMGDGVAHASLSGVALALLVGWAPLPVAMIVAVLIACAIFFIERYGKITSDAAIGIFFTTGMALGVVLLNFSNGFQPELISFLFGNILSINTFDILTIAAVGSILILYLIVFSRQLTFATIDSEGSYLHGQSKWGYDLSLYIAITIAIILSIKLLGIVLVSALLIIPTSISGQFATSFSSYRLMSVIVSVFVVVCGLFLSYIFDLPSGATIVLFGTLLFVFSFLTKFIVRPKN